MVRQGEEKAMAEKSPIGSLSMAPNTERSMRPPRRAWLRTRSLVLRSWKERRLYLRLRMRGVRAVSWTQHRRRSRCQGVTEAVEAEERLASLMRALLEGGETGLLRGLFLFTRR